MPGRKTREVLLRRAAIDFVDPSDRFPIDRQEAELARHGGRRQLLAWRSVPTI